MDGMLVPIYDDDPTDPYLTISGRSSVIGEAVGMSRAARIARDLCGGGGMPQVVDASGSQAGVVAGVVLAAIGAAIGAALVVACAVAAGSQGVAAVRVADFAKSLVV